MTLVRSLKLRFFDTHVRISLAADAGPGVDVRGARAQELFALAAPAVDWLLARQPGVALRALLLDLGSRRVLVSFDDAHAAAAPTGTRPPPPMVLRIEARDSAELLARAAPLVARVTELAAEALANRGA